MPIQPEIMELLTLPVYCRPPHDITEVMAAGFVILIGASQYRRNTTALHALAMVVHDFVGVVRAENEAMYGFKFTSSEGASRFANFVHFAELAGQITT